MRFVTTFDDYRPERLMVMLNAGELSPEQVRFVRDIYERNEFDFRFLSQLEDVAGVKSLSYHYKLKQYQIGHTNPMHPRDLFFIGLFRNKYESRLWARCPSCGAWFVDRNEIGVCSIGCVHKMQGLAASGVIALPRK